MARLEISNAEVGAHVVVTLSKRNLLALLHKLELAGSSRTLVNGDCHVDGQLALGVLLVLRAEDDEEHYAKRPTPPGTMHPATESAIRAGGGWSPLKG